ncbi:MAG TPA: signal peptidase I [Acidimicrobiales bacterium]|nr:signal peptidase I [Acidimicrobiales bacterium]
MLAWRSGVEPSEGEQEPEGLPPFAPEQRRGPSLLGELPLLVVVAVVIAFLIRTLLGQFFYIPSQSMGCAQCPVHTLEINDKVLVSKMSYRLHHPRRGDVVVFQCPSTAQCDNHPHHGNPAVRAVRWIGERLGIVQPSTEDYIKRVIALPGETVEGHGGRVFVDGRLLDEPYLPRAVVTSEFAPVTVPAGRLWVMGDNRAQSQDSRFFGPIDSGTLIGRAVMRVWPLHRVGFL